MPDPVQPVERTEPSQPAGSRRAAAWFILVTVLLDMLALGMIIPVLPLLIEQFRGGDTASAARTIGVFGAVFAAIQFFAAPVLGALSDRFGRRPVILLSNFGLGTDYALMALAPTLGWLFAGRILTGITAASVPTAMAYIADVTPPEKRARAYGMIGAAFGVGFIIGPALGGLLGVFGPRTPFWVASALSLANAMWGLFVLPESHHVDHRAEFSWKRANPLGSIRLLASHHELFGFATLHFLYNLAHQSLQGVFVLYTTYRYGWTSAQVGGSLAAVGVCFAITQAGLVGRVVARFGERRSLISGLVFGTIGFAIYGYAPTGTIFLVGIPIMSLWGLYGPAAQGMMTQRVGRRQQGALQGALSSVQMATGLIGPVLFAETFAAFIDPERAWHVPGAPFLLSSLLLGVGALIALRVARPLAADA